MAHRRSQSRAQGAPSATLMERLDETSFWVARLESMAEALAVSICDWSLAGHAHIVDAVGQPLDDLLVAASTGGRRWAKLLLLESRPVQRAATVVLIKKISERGIFRDLSGLREIGVAAVGLFIVAVVQQANRDVTRIVRFVEECLESQKLQEQAAADATLLGLLLTGRELEAIQQHVRNEELSEILIMAHWISSVDAGTGEGLEVSLPTGLLSQAWFENRAYRGMRRHWARKYGRSAGSEGSTSLPPWLQATNNTALCAEGYGATIVEWVLAAVRAWPNREEMIQTHPLEIRDRALALGVKTANILKNCEECDALREWLRTSLRDIVAAPFTEQRLFRNTN